MKVLLLLLLITRASKSLPWEKDVAESTTVAYTSESPTEPSYDYVVEIGFNLNEEKVPEFIVTVIYENSTEKSITTDDVISLYGLRTLDLDEILNVFDELGIVSQNVFSLDGFDKFLTELSMDFKEYYNRVLIDRLNITGNPLRDLLLTLEIDINNFSMGMAYGDPNPYEEFKKGNFSKYSVETALQKAGKTLDDLFIATRDEFLSKAESIGTKKVVESLTKYNFDKAKALKLWNVLDLTVESVYRVPVFQSLLTELNQELNKIPSIGVLTGTNNITINKKAYDTWKQKEDYVKLYAESISHKFILEIVDTLFTDLDNILLLKSIAIEPYDKNSLPYIDIGTSSKDLADCKFITVLNGTVIIRDISVAVNRESYFEIPKDNITELIPGSPLICSSKLYGIAREMSSENIILDSFSGVGRMIMNTYLLGVSLAVCVCIYFL